MWGLEVYVCMYVCMYICVCVRVFVCTRRFTLGGCLQLGEKVVDTSGSDWYSTAASITLSQSAAVCVTTPRRQVRSGKVIASLCLRHNPASSCKVR